MFALMHLIVLLCHFTLCCTQTLAVLLDMFCFVLLWFALQWAGSNEVIISLETRLSLSPEMRGKQGTLEERPVSF